MTVCPETTPTVIKQAFPMALSHILWSRGRLQCASKLGIMRPGRGEWQENKSHFCLGQWTSETFSLPWRDLSTFHQELLSVSFVRASACDHQWGIHGRARVSSSDQLCLPTTWKRKLRAPGSPLCSPSPETREYLTVNKDQVHIHQLCGTWLLPANAINWSACWNTQPNTKPTDRSA